MRAIGLHLRSTDEFSSVINEASTLLLPIFQAFCKIHNGVPVSLTAELIAHYERLSVQFTHRIAHASYSINLAHPAIGHHHSLKRELYCAQKLQFSHLLFHPGAVPEGHSRQEALDQIVNQINYLTKQETDLKFVLENSAHGKRSLGGNIEELAYIQARLAMPEKVSFCIDTAHAYVFGYSVHEETSGWIEMVTNLLTPHAISMLHLNDTQAVRGSYDDRHCAPGKGNIGVAALKNIMRHPHLKATPLIIELPSVTADEQKLALEEVRSWE